jgi:hypothetical protein
MTQVKIAQKGPASTQVGLVDCESLNLGGYVREGVLSRSGNMVADVIRIVTWREFLTPVALHLLP